MLVRRHGVTGLRGFSAEAFAHQLAVPGMLLFRALHGETTVGAMLCLLREDTAYVHLSAQSPEGYKLRAAYALHWSVLTYLVGRVQWIDLGGGAGVSNEGSDGLSAFKRGWATGTRMAYFCGRTLDPDRYRAITENRRVGATGYFPVYREGEFGV
jgi:hypothetical protein